MVTPIDTRANAAGMAMTSQSATALKGNTVLEVRWIGQGDSQYMEANTTRTAAFSREVTARYLSADGKEVHEGRYFMRPEAAQVYQCDPFERMGRQERPLAPADVPAGSAVLDVFAADAQPQMVADNSTLSGAARRLDGIRGTTKGGPTSPIARPKPEKK